MANRLRADTLAIRSAAAPSSRGSRRCPGSRRVRRAERRPASPASGSGASAKPTQHDRQQRPLDRRTPRDTTGESFEMAQRARRSGVSELLQPLAGRIGVSRTSYAVAAPRSVVGDRTASRAVDGPPRRSRRQVSGSSRTARACAASDRARQLVVGLRTTWVRQSRSDRCGARACAEGRYASSGTPRRRHGPRSRRQCEPASAVGVVSGRSEFVGTPVHELK